MLNRLPHYSGDMSSGDATDRGPGRRGKVDRILDEYDLEGVEEELVEGWTREGADRRSLRDLAAYFNKQLLAEVLDRHGVGSVATDVETVYRELEGEGASDGSRTRTHRQLEREGVDASSLLDEFVSHTAVRTFFRNRDVSRPDGDTDRVATEAGHIQQLQNRTAVVTEDKLESLDETERIQVGDFRVFVDVQVFCEDCQQQYDVTELLEARYCSCHSP